MVNGTWHSLTLHPYIKQFGFSDNEKDTEKTMCGVCGQHFEQSLSKFQGFTPLEY